MLNINSKKHLLIVISGAILFVSAITSYIYINFVYNDIKLISSEDAIACKYVKGYKDSFCKTDKIKYYSASIKFDNKKRFKLNKLHNIVYFNDLDIEDIQKIKREVVKTAIKKSLKLKDKNTIDLAQLIIKNYDSTETDNKKLLLNNIKQITRVNDYIAKGDNVKLLSPKEIALLPVNLIKSKNKEIKYSITYDGSIVNYYSSNGKLILKEYIVNSKPYRYQVYDETDFYTYDSNKKLLEYSQNNHVYNSNKQLVYYSGNTEQSVPMIKNNNKNYNISQKDYLANQLTDKDSEIYKSITNVVEKYYSKGSYVDMLIGLNTYFNELSIKNPELYNYYYKLVKKRPVTINFGKTNNGILYSVNKADAPHNDIIIASMADTINAFNGECAEPNLKIMAKDELINKYFYDIKIQVSNKKIVCKEHPPCNTCNKHVSIWGWKYPKTSINK